MQPKAAVSDTLDVPGPDMLSGIKNRRLHQHQLKYYEKIVLPALWANPDSWPFHKAVDPVALNLPDYITIIKHPMDLGLVKAKLARLEYQLPEDVASDIQLVLDNCRLYNKPGTEIVAMCDAVERQFQRLMAAMPKDGETLRVPEDTSAYTQERRSSTKTRTTSKKDSKKAVAPIVIKQGTPSAGKKSGKRGTDMYGGGTTLNHIEAAPNGLPLETENGKRGKRKSNKPEHLTFETSRKVRLSPQLRFCLNIIKEFYSKKHQKLAWPFYEPVDPVALGLPDYHTIIKTPVDLSLIKKKLETGEYRSPAEFASDMRLMFTNCYRYNPAKTEVFEAGRQLQDVFELKYALLPDDNGASDADSSSSSSDEDEDVEGGDEDEEGDEEQGDPEELARKQKLEELQVMVQMLQGSIAELSKSDNAKTTSRRGSTNSKSGSKERKSNLSAGSTTQLERKSSLGDRRHPITGQKLGTKQRTTSTSSVGSASGTKRRTKQPKVSKTKKRKYDVYEHRTEDHSMLSTPRTKKAKGKVMDPRPMSFEEKRRLSCAINRLAPDKIPALVNIIQERIPPLKHCPAEELEIDIDSLDPLTLRMLDNYVREVTEVPKKPRGPSKAKGPSEAGRLGAGVEGMAELVAEAQRARRGRSPSESSSSSS
eukprot:Ihof_evm4s214 gene=Ihof_evmTU4s214